MAYEAALQSKLQAEQAARERAAKDREAWASLPPWRQDEERCKEDMARAQEGWAAPAGSASGCGIVDPWEAVAYGSGGGWCWIWGFAASGSRS